MQFFKNALILLLLVISLVNFGQAINCDKYGVLFYEDIACKAVKTEENKCPSQYDCNFAQPKSGCLFKGKNFESREEIPSDLTYSDPKDIRHYSVRCRCDDLNSIACAVLNCPGHLGYRLNFGCYFGYELGQWCSTGRICTSTQTKTCEVDGNSYKIGERFYPKDTCYSCVCHENFIGEYDDKTCMRHNCNLQIYASSEITKNCAPAYFDDQYDENLCCPNDFVCLDPSDTIEVVNPNVEKESNLECSFGEKKLKLGEGLKKNWNKYGKDRNLQCECVIPPLLICKEI